MSVLGAIVLGGTGVAAAREPPGARTPTARLPHAQSTLVLAGAEEPQQRAGSPVAAGKAGEAQPATGKVGEAQPAGGAAVAFGENFFGELGTFYRDNYEDSPVAVEGLANITEVAGSESFNIALLTDGTVASWGGNADGQLGDNRRKPNWQEGRPHALVQEENPLTHAIVGPLKGVKAIAAANHHAIALMSSGTVMAWGTDGYGQLGDGTQGVEGQLNIDERTPKAVPGLQSVQAVAAGGGSDYALTRAGTVLAWGNNTQGQLGLGQPGPDRCYTEVAHYPKYDPCSERPLPVMWMNPSSGRHEQLSDVRAIFAGDSSGYALLGNGRLLAWGNNDRAQLGAGTETSEDEVPPVEVKRADGLPLSGIAEVAAGARFVLARLEDGEVLGWGSAAHDDLAGLPGEECRGGSLRRRRRPGSSSEPHLCVKLAARIPSLERLHPQALSAGSGLGLALASGVVYAWGNDEHGQLGNGRVSPRGEGEGFANPAKLPGIGPASAVLAAGTHSVVVLRGAVPAPPPLVVAVPGPLSIRLSWRAETTAAAALVAEHLLYRLSEHTGEREPAEQGDSEGEEGPPVNLPSEPVHLRFVGERREEDMPLVGERLSAEPGGWTGARPIKFTIQWQRCNSEGEACANIAGATHGGYGLAAADVGLTVRAVITATGPVPPSTSVATEATEPVAEQAAGESARNAATSVKLSGGALSFTITGTIERTPLLGEVVKPLQALPYEVRFSASGRARVMIVAPMAEAARPN